MAVYRYQVVSVGFWRGKVKRWNTTFHMTRSDRTPQLKDRMDKSGYPAPGDTNGDCSGGVAAIYVYDSTGGAPIHSTVYFDWESPSTWKAYDGSYWTEPPTGTTLDASAESAALLVGTMPYLSSTGKPVTVRKYLHAIPSRYASDYGDPDIDSTQQTHLVQNWSTSYMCAPNGIEPTTLHVEPYYYNHQRVRGRRRSRKASRAESFSAGVVTGAGAAAGGGHPFP